MAAKTELTPREAGHKAAVTTMKRRHKANSNPMLAMPSHKTFQENSSQWDEFLAGWMDAVREYKEEMARVEN